MPPPSAITFIVPARAGASRGAGAADASIETGIPGTRKVLVHVAAQRDAGAPVRVDAKVDEDVVVLYLEGGFELVLHPESARDLMLAQAGSKGLARGAAGAVDEPAEVQVPATLQWQGLEQAAASRGAGFLGQVGLRAFEVVKALFKGDEVAGWAAGKIAQQIDGKVVPGVYRLSPVKLEATRPGVAPGAIVPPLSGRPVLVLLHGTFVDTVSTFGKLWDHHGPRVRELFTHYADQVYALDHATMGDSPIGNALLLVRALPKSVPVELHLVTHSRGGLVAEVLARAVARPIGAQDLQAFAGPRHQQLRAQLQALADALAERQVTVARVVRVACPARGTLLASGRLDAYLSVLRWGLKAAGVPVVPLLVDFLTAVARERFDPQVLPGMAAMTPDNPLVQWLNDAQAAIPGELRVVAGDREGDSLGTWLKTLMADAFYWTDNDIVVQTSSMYGGAPRTEGASYLLDQGGNTTHFAYFKNPRTANAVVDALLLDAPAGFAPIGPLSWAGDSATGSRGAMRRGAAARPDKPAVFVLPGILGSNIQVQGRRIWLGWRVLGGLERLAYAPGQTDVGEGGPIGSFYDKLMEFLDDTHEVIPFGFDWRRPLEEEADRLGKRVTEALNARAATGQPVAFVAHSMGGLLVRTMALECPKVWERVIAHPRGRLLMLGTPNGGSWAPMQVLSGDDSFGNMLVALGAPFRDGKARMLMAQFPGFLQMQAGLLDPALKLGDPATWSDLAQQDKARVEQASWWHRNVHANEAGDTQLSAYTWGVPSQLVLQQAVALRQRLDRQLVDDLPRWADRLAIVVGRARFTPDGYEMGEQGFVYLDALDGGDGRVTLAQARLPQVPTWTLAAEHGELPQRKEAFADYLSLLLDGTAKGLAALAACGQRGAVMDAPAPLVHVRSRPSRGNMAGARPADSEQSVFATTRGVEAVDAGTRLQPLRVTVVNGNLAFVRQPLMVGHYTASRLTGAEQAVNELVGGVMGEALDVGRYPQTVGVAQVFRNLAAPRHDALLPRPEGVVVVGLGPEGGLTEALLAESVCQGVLAWAERQAEHVTERLAEGATESAVGIELAAVLMGSGGIGFQPGNAARAIVIGVRAANGRILQLNDKRKRATWPYVAHLRLVELYLERAGEAWRGLQVHATARPGELQITPQIEVGTASLRRQADSTYRGAAHDFISITSLGSDGQSVGAMASPQGTASKGTAIQFRLDTRRARTEVRAVRAQSSLLAELLLRASNELGQDAQIGRTLFQLLVPLEIEPFLAGRTQMLLEVDRGTAAVPWELLDTPEDERSDADAQEPWGVRSRLIRKLATSSYRDVVRDTDRDDLVLVIGEPQSGPGYGSLPAALREAQQVAALMQDRVGPSHTKALLGGADATAVINALMASPYRIVHVAGHGEGGAEGGVVLSGGTFLGPREISQMRAVPELVFVNCCHLAKFPDGDMGKRPDPFDRSAFAASTAEALIAAGVRCVVAAGWAVDDDPAELFARTFYTALLDGSRFMDAVGDARQKTWSTHRNSNTWAAYQCYGDPEWRMRSRRGQPKPQAAEDLKARYSGVASAAGLLFDLERLTVEATYESTDAPEKHRRERHVQYLAARFGPVWGEQGAVAEALGAACVATELNDEGISWYEKALAASDGGASLKAVEQLANQRARRAWLRVGALKPDASATETARASARQTLVVGRNDIASALADLSALVRVKPSVERHAVMGSAYKRLAMLERQAFALDKAWAAPAPEGAAKRLSSAASQARAAERKALQDMAAAYGLAEALARAQQDRSWYYPASNGLAARLLGLASAEEGKAFAESFQAVRAEVDEQIARGGDFWLVACRIELDLYEALALLRLDVGLPAIAAQVRDLHRRVKAANHWSTLRDQAQFMLDRWTEKPWVPTGERQAAGRYQELLLGLVSAT